MREPPWAKPSIVGKVILAYLAAHFAVRMAMWPTLGLDDAEQALFAQDFAWTYRYRAPPLFTWLLVGVGEIIPVGIVSISILRYALLGATFWFSYLTARRLIGDARLAALSVYSFAVIYLFAYYSHHDLTHTTALSAILAAAWYVFVRLAEARSLAWYVLLGAVFGLGMLAKWNFVMFAAALPLACLFNRDFRRLVTTPKILAALTAGAAVALPSIVAAWRLGPPPGEDVRSVLGGAQGFSSALLEGSWRLLLAVITYPLPFLPLALTAFAVALWRGLRSQSPATGDSPVPDIALIGSTMAISIAMHWGLVLVLGATDFSERLMQPALLILPIWLFMLIERGRPSSRAIGGFALILLMLALATLGVRIGIYSRGADGCGTCRALVPFAALAEQVREQGFDGRGTILASDFSIGGNMRVMFPQARVIVPGYPLSVWPKVQGEGACLLLWEADGDAVTADGPPAELRAYLAGPLRGKANASHRIGSISLPMFRSSRQYRLSFQLYEKATGDCR